MTYILYYLIGLIVILICCPSGDFDDILILSFVWPIILLVTIAFKTCAFVRDAWDEFVRS